jgi:hypothetical protein
MAGIPESRLHYDTSVQINGKPTNLILPGNQERILNKDSEAASLTATAALGGADAEVR